jgi:hypothetical protein
MTDNVEGPEGAEVPSKNLGRRKLLQMLTAGGGLAAAAVVPGAWTSPVADVLGTAPAAAGVAPSPTPTGSVSPSVTVSVSTSPPPPTPSVQAGVVNATPPFTG